MKMWTDIDKRSYNTSSYTHKFSVSCESGKWGFSFLWKFDQALGKHCPIPMADLQKILQNNGYAVFCLGSMNDTGLLDILHKMCLLMIVSWLLGKQEDAFHHVVVIFPKICQNGDSSKMLVWIIEGWDPEERPTEFTNVYWCVGQENGIDSIRDAFMFCPGTKL